MTNEHLGVRRGCASRHTPPRRFAKHRPAASKKLAALAPHKDCSNGPWSRHYTSAAVGTRCGLAMLLCVDSTLVRFSRKDEPKPSRASDAQERQDVGGAPDGTGHRVNGAPEHVLFQRLADEPVRASRSQPVRLQRTIPELRLSPREDVCEEHDDRTRRSQVSTGI